MAWIKQLDGLEQTEVTGGCHHPPPPLLPAPACPLPGKECNTELYRDRASRHRLVRFLAVQPWVGESASLGLFLLGLLKRGSGGSVGLGAMLQKDLCEDRAKPGVGKHSINSPLHPFSSRLPEHTLSFQRQLSVLLLKRRQSEVRDSGLCRHLRDFLCPLNSPGECPEATGAYNQHSTGGAVTGVLLPGSHEGKH